MTDSRLTTQDSGNSAALIEGPQTIFDLGHEFYPEMPVPVRHPGFDLQHPRFHGDARRADGTSSANDLVSMGTHIGTHVDALSHYSDDGRLHGGVAVELSGVLSVERAHSAETLPIFWHRGFLLDFSRHFDLEHCAPGYEIKANDLEDICSAIGLDIPAGSVVLVRTGWDRYFDTGAEKYLAHPGGVPGLGHSGARWLSDRGVVAAGTDTAAFDAVTNSGGLENLPAHKELLVNHGIYIIENLNLQHLAAAAVNEFLFVMAPLRLRGATASPVRPFAVV